MSKWRRYNPETEKYEPYTTPAEWKVPVHCDDLEETVNCAACGKEQAFGDCYTSRYIHNLLGFAASVCEDCHDKEWGE